jgi:hypothetical protein
MSWHFSRALVEEYLAENSSDGERFAPLNMTNTPEAFLSLDKTTDVLSRFLYGMTCEHSMETNGKEKSTSLQAASLVKTLVSPEMGMVLTENDQAFGKSSLGSLAKYDQDTHLWKTAQRSLFEDLESFSGTWPRWGTMRNGECFPLLMLEHDTSANAFGSWPTPTKWEEKYVRSKSPGDHYHGIGWILWNQYNLQPTPEVYEALMVWPIGWTGSHDAATDKYQQWLRLHGVY